MSDETKLLEMIRESTVSQFAIELSHELQVWGEAEQELAADPQISLKQMHEHLARATAYFVAGSYAIRLAGMRLRIVEEEAARSEPGREPQERQDGMKRIVDGAVSVTEDRF